MGFFEFLKDVGGNLLGKGNDVKAINDLLQEELGSKIENLQVEFKDGNAKLFGTCDTPETREKAILLTGNLKGVNGVDAAELTYEACQIEDSEQTATEQADIPKPAALKAPELTTEFYTIKSGDTLSAIAKHYYGDANKYNLIFEANREVIKHPDKIYPGQQIRIPKK